MEASDMINLESMSCPSTKVAQRNERKKYLKKSGKSLWMKNKLHKTGVLSIEASTQSSEGSMTFYSSNVCASNMVSLLINLVFI